MAENSTPYIIQINEPIYTINVPQDPSNTGLQINPVSHKLSAMGIGSNSLLVNQSNPITVVREMPQSNLQNVAVLNQEEQPCIFQVVYPQDLCLSPMQNGAKRGRPKKKRQEELKSTDNTPINDVPGKVEPPKTARTRSGRLVKLPKYIEKDFKKIEIAAEEQEIQVSDFKRFEEEASTLEFTELQAKKRTISSQYRCPKCSKAYLGKNKMIQHLKKNPDHGPLPEGYQEFNFDVWNYLFDITQKCKSGQRGIKFCEELSNLLHNLQLLKNALFKTVTDSKNSVQIDKVLGNAIGLPPGKYRFDENELYKDVTVLQLITNSDFFKPTAVNNKQTSDNISCKENDDIQSDHCEHKKIKQGTSTADAVVVVNSIDTRITEKVDATKRENIKVNNSMYDFSMKVDANVCNKPETNVSQTFEKKMEVHNNLLTSELLTENLLLQSPPNARTSEDELMLTAVDNSSNLLDNSTSSDEVMNVDQFVNERFKKIIEPDIELANTSLNLDLPSLELFQFHTS